ncbi:MAG: NAD+ synthase [Aeromonadales bacterium]|nr:NAD+ synthase [Aeromonadales bacterium]
MSKQLSLALAQLNVTVGAIESNTQLIVATIREAEQQGADLVLFPELALTGYLPDDLLWRDDLYQRLTLALDTIAAASSKIAILIGHPWREQGQIYNSASVYEKGQLVTRYVKQGLANGGLYDEPRYFTAGGRTEIVEISGYRLGLTIGQDIANSQWVGALKAAGAEILLNLSASTFHPEQTTQQAALLTAVSRSQQLPVVMLNLVGGQDEWLFSGCSQVVNAKGVITQQLAAFDSELALVKFEQHTPVAQDLPAPLAPLAQLYQALVLATRDYINKNGFSGAVLGLSGGIDSALTLAIAVDALGKDKVQAVMMPFRYTASISVDDAKEQAELLGVEFDSVSIEPMFDAFMAQLAPLFANETPQPWDTTEENLQARARGMILMALSNKRHRLVLTTGNKSELAVGYCTLYGDMVGGFAPLKDVSKTLVFALSRYRNSLGYAIPQRVIDRPPSAELAPDQLDQDNLPPYDVLDPLLAAYVEQDQSPQQLIDAGFAKADVQRIIKLVDINEYKRRQGAVGPSVSARSFGKGRRYPITSGFGKPNW